MSWWYLVITGLFEVGFAFCMGKIRQEERLTLLLWVASFLGCMVASMYFLQKSLSEIPLGTAYAVWTGIGAVGTMLVGIFFFKEPADFWQNPLKDKQDASAK